MASNQAQAQQIQSQQVQKQSAPQSALAGSDFRTEQQFQTLGQAQLLALCKDKVDGLPLSGIDSYDKKQLIKLLVEHYEEEDDIYGPHVGVQKKPERYLNFPYRLRMSGDDKKIEAIYFFKWARPKAPSKEWTRKVWMIPIKEWKKYKVEAEAFNEAFPNGAHGEYYDVIEGMNGQSLFVGDNDEFLHGYDGYHQGQYLGTSHNSNDYVYMLLTGLMLFFVISCICLIVGGVSSAGCYIFGKVSTERKYKEKEAQSYEV